MTAVLSAQAPPIPQLTRSDFVRLNAENMILSQRAETLQELCEHHKSKYEQTVARFRLDWNKKEAEYTQRINHLQQQLINQRLKLNAYETKLKSSKHQLLQRDIAHHKKIKFIDNKIKHFLANIRGLRQENKRKDEEIESLKQELKLIALPSQIAALPTPDAFSKGNPTPSLIKIRIPDTETFPDCGPSSAVPTDPHTRSSTEHSFTNVSAKIYPYLELSSPNLSLKSNPSARKKKKSGRKVVEKKESDEMNVAVSGTMMDSMIAEEESSDSEDEPPLPASSGSRRHVRYTSNASAHSVLSHGGSVQPLYSQLRRIKSMSRSNITEFTEGTLSPIETVKSNEGTLSPTASTPCPFLKESQTPELENVDASEPMCTVQKATL